MESFGCNRDFHGTFFGSLRRNSRLFVGFRESWCHQTLILSLRLLHHCCQWITTVCFLLHPLSFVPHAYAARPAHKVLSFRNSHSQFLKLYTVGAVNSERFYLFSHVGHFSPTIFQIRPRQCLTAFGPFPAPWFSLTLGIS